MPIKRSEYLKPLSRDHHQGLLLCWKIRTGLKKGIVFIFNHGKKTIWREKFNCSVLSDRGFKFC